MWQAHLNVVGLNSNSETCARVHILSLESAVACLRSTNNVVSELPSAIYLPTVIYLATKWLLPNIKTTATIPITVDAFLEALNLPSEHPYAQPQDNAQGIESNDGKE